MFQVYPVVLLGDFGLSAPLKEARTYGIGTIGYMAPVSTDSTVEESKTLILGC
jgi:hypothetical protein